MGGYSSKGALHEEEFKPHAHHETNTPYFKMLLLQAAHVLKDTACNSIRPCFFRPIFFEPHPKFNIVIVLNLVLHVTGNAPYS